MLVLTRRIGETLIIGDDIKVMVLEVSGNQVHIGIEAPRHIAVNREKIHQRKMAEVNQPRTDIPAAPLNAIQAVTVIRRKSTLRLDGRERDA